MKRENENISIGFSRRKRGMALPITLIVLLVAGAMVAISLYLIENMAITTKMKTDDELRLNAATAGIEIGKQWVVNSILDDRHIPRRQSSDDVTSSDIIPGDTKFEYLFAVDKNSNPLNENHTIENVPVTVFVYDLTYTVRGTDVEFLAGIPPRMYEDPSESAGEGSSIVARQGYLSSNRGSGGSEGGTTYVENGFYLVRSTATLNGISKTVEQAVRMRF